MLLTVTIGVFIMIVAFFLFKKRKHPSIMKLPGPPPNLFMGNLIDFMGPTSLFLTTLRNYIEKYGSILKVHNGPFSCLIVVADEKFLEYILSSTALITKSEEYEYLQNWLGTGLLTSTGSKWKKRRRMITPSFHFSILENFVEVFDSVSDVFIKKLEEHVGKDSFDIYPLVSLCTLDIICEAAMGISINAQIDGSSKYVKSVKTMCSILTDRNFSPLDPRFYPFTINYYREKAALKILHDHTDKVIDERLKSKDLINQKNDNEYGIKSRLAFLDMLIKSEINGVPLSRMDIREEVDTFMFEGHDTTSSAVSFVLYNLSTHPEVQKKALEEQHQIFGNAENPKATMTDLQNMKYLELVIKETLRLYPSVPFFARQVIEDFEWDGVLYPRGVTLILMAYWSHRDPKNFPDPEKFNPERFNEADGSHPYVYIPFSAGPRNCIGQKFAMLEIKSTVSKVLRNFELHPAKPAHKLELAPEIIMISKSGIKLSLRKRNNNK